MINFHCVPQKEVSRVWNNMRVRKLAFELATFHGLPCPVEWANNGMAGESWFTNFMRRDQNLSVRRPQATSLTRSTSFNEKNVETFNNLATVYRRYGFESKDIWNVDETGLTIVQKPGLLVSTKGERRVGSVTSAERGALITMALTSQSPAPAITGQDCVWATEKKHFSCEMDKWHWKNPGETLTLYDLPQLLNNILLMGASPQNVKKGFRSTGIWPFNPDIFSKDYFLPASVTDRPPPDESLPGLSTSTFTSAPEPSTSTFTSAPAPSTSTFISAPEPSTSTITSAPGPSTSTFISAPGPSTFISPPGPSTGALALPEPTMTVNSDGLQEVTLTLVPVPLSLQEEEVTTTKENVPVFCPEIIKPYPKAGPRKSHG
ncbi:uncharacterized protein LOC107707317 [Sinocyclocheilus rhinocerous]|uniref:uncharacterized protein LOC107707317 n=1 Tax=Sinocyclocheilus rhinocerous TaxID=307959 RepID=UPI0007B95522|nr:PREDICTED: uncharacterized protein LOC107707317 [Sinocyclocheilus rhinocerous]